MNASEEPPPESQTTESLREDHVPSEALKLSDWRYWLRRLFVCNPFYLCSAALLLLGVNRLSIDPNFLGVERHNLVFNFVALHAYGALLTLTAIALRRRRVWYDSALLVVLENGLALVPFMLISQAALISPGLGWALGLIGGGLVAARATMLRRGYPEFHLPLRASLLGSLILTVNVAIPFWFESVVAKTAISDWELPNQWIWWVFLPALALGANWLPRPKTFDGNQAQRSWLPLLIYALWIGGSAAHAWCVAYLGKFPFGGLQLAPLVMVLCWTLWNRLTDCCRTLGGVWRSLPLIGAALTPLLALDDLVVLQTMLALQGCAFLFLAMHGPVDQRTVAKCLLGLTTFFVVGWMPQPWLHLLGVDRSSAIAMTLSGSIILAMIRSRLPVWGLLGGTVSAFALVWKTNAEQGYLSLNVGLAVALVHSLFWDDSKFRDAPMTRRVLAVVWATNAVLWTKSGSGWDIGVASCFGLAMLLAWILSTWWRGTIVSRTLAVASVVTILAGPTDWILIRSHGGLLLMVASLASFALGTWVAWRRQYQLPRNPGSITPGSECHPDSQ